MKTTYTSPDAPRRQELRDAMHALLELVTQAEEKLQRIRGLCDSRTRFDEPLEILERGAVKLRFELDRAVGRWRKLDTQQARVMQEILFQRIGGTC